MTNSRRAPENVVREYLARGEAASSEKPTLVLITGPVASGKTTHRREKYARGYVVVDAAEIFVSLAPQEVLPFPSALLEELEAAGQQLAVAAVAERRNIVTEILGVHPGPVEAVVGALGAAGYEVTVVFVDADPAEAWERNVKRGPNDISAYFAEPFNVRWLVRAAEQYAARHVASDRS